MRSQRTIGKALSAVAAALLAFGSSAPQANALVQVGTWQVAQCCGATASFVEVPKNKGFANSTHGVTLVNAGAGTAGVQLVVPPPPTGYFAFIRFAVRLSDRASAQNTNVHFCFSNGASFDRSLAQLSKSRPSGGWQAVTVSNRDFEGIRSSLVKITFALNGTGNVTIGETLIQITGPLEDNAPSDRDFIVAGCGVLNSCNTEMAPANN